MSRYYDPVTHRFVNSDGYFQSGGNLLDTNMNAYCRNNPVNCYDPTGTYCKEHGSYYKPNCTSCNSYYVEYKIQQAAKAKNKQNDNWKSRKDKRKNSEDRQPSGARERNRGHINGEEHSRVPKGNGPRRIENDYLVKVVAVEGIIIIGTGIIILAIDDITVAGIADDAAILPATAVMWECFEVLLVG